MGTEIVFALIWPVLMACVAAAIWAWFGVARLEQPTAIGRIRAYLPLTAGFAISMASLLLLTYIGCDADFTSLVRQGYYSEADRSVYLPDRVAGQAIVNLLFALPLICFVVIPWTTKRIIAARLNWRAIGLRILIAWLVLSLLGWSWSLGNLNPTPSFAEILKSTAVPILICGLPIPIAALAFCRSKLLRER